MTARAFNTGLIVGRFQIFHIGHERMVRTALKLCRTVLLLVGSSQEARTATNPLSYAERREMIGTVFAREVAAGRLRIEPLPDLGVGNVPAWGQYVLNTAVSFLGTAPELLVSGKEVRRVNWFDAANAQLAELYVPKTVEISASQLRELLLGDAPECCREFIPEKLWPRLAAYRDVILASRDNNETASV